MMSRFATVALLGLTACSAPPPAAEPAVASSPAPAPAATATAEPTCPDGTTRAEQRFEGKILVQCKRPDGAIHGRSTLSRTDGTVLEKLDWKDDQPDGVGQRFHPDGSPWQEVHIVRGALHGHARAWNTAGDLVVESFWEHGNLVRWVVHVGEMPGDRRYRNGERHGTWKLASETRVYRDGVLLSVDGAAVPAPAPITFPDGSRLSRSECNFTAGRRGPLSPVPLIDGTDCVDLFETVQRCTSEACRKQAIEGYARKNDRAVALPPVELANGRVIRKADCRAMDAGSRTICLGMLEEHRACQTDACRERVVRSYLEAEEGEDAGDLPLEDLLDDDSTDDPLDEEMP